MKLREVAIVDDSDADLLYTRLVLESVAIAQTVSTFETARELLDRLVRPEGHAIDVILLDINMPEMSGFEFLEAYEHLHRSQQARAVVVMLTNSPDPRDRERALSFGCVKGYVVKPVDAPAARRLLALARPPGDAA